MFHDTQETSSQHVGNINEVIPNATVPHPFTLGEEKPTIPDGYHQITYTDPADESRTYVLDESNPAVNESLKTTFIGIASEMKRQVNTALNWLGSLMLPPESEYERRRIEFNNKLNLFMDNIKYHYTWGKEQLIRELNIHQELISQFSDMNPVIFSEDPHLLPVFFLAGRQIKFFINKLNQQNNIADIDNPPEEKIHSPDSIYGNNSLFISLPKPSQQTTPAFKDQELNENYFGSHFSL